MGKLIDMIKINCLFICTSAKDRSPALSNYFSEIFPENQYRSAGINEYFCKKHGTHLISKEDIEWADLIVYAENIHSSFVNSRFQTGDTEWVILNCGEYKQDSPMAEDYLTSAEIKLSHYLNNKNEDTEK